MLWKEFEHCQGSGRPGYRTRCLFGFWGRVELPQAIFQKLSSVMKKVLNIAREAGDRAREGKAYFNLGIVYDFQSDFSKAIECYEKALNIVREAADRAGVTRANQHLGILTLPLEIF